jgi:uncharacterized protein DUF3347
MMQMKTIMLAMSFMVAPLAVSAAELPKTLIDPYLQVQMALVNDAFDQVAAPAKAFETATATLGGDGSKLAASAKKLTSSKNIESARNAFGEVSEELVAYAKKTKSEFPADVREAYCPMVDKPWLQKDKDIKNPYYGQAMLTCGSFRKN